MGRFHDDNQFACMLRNPRRAGSFSTVFVGSIFWFRSLAVRRLFGIRCIANLQTILSLF